MIILVISIIALGIIAALIAKLSKHDGEEKITVVETCATCNGTNDKCEQDCMMEAATKDIVYYDDEELDAFKGRPSDSYTDEDVLRRKTPRAHAGGILSRLVITPIITVH